MSRGHNARQKARRQQARDPAEVTAPARASWRRRMWTLPPILIIFAIVGVSSFGFGAGNPIDKQQIEREVTTVLAGIPQHGRTLGSPHAPLTVQIFADLECPTVRLFAIKYLPRLIADWVRPGLVQIRYRPLETDTLNEQTFFRQEAATLAAGEQDKLWNFFLTFVREQKLEYSGYATDPFLADIGSQIRGLHKARWQQDGSDPVLTEQVALDLQAAHSRDLSYTPSFLLAPTPTKAEAPGSRASTESVRKRFRASLTADIAALRKETTQDNPALHELELSDRKEIRELTGQ